MATTDQLDGVAAYRSASAKLSAAESAQLDAMTDAAAAQGQLDRALAMGDQAAADAARAALSKANASKDKAGIARERAVSAMTGARRRALGNGSGFDLLSGAHPLLLLPVRIETRFAWTDGAGARTFAPIAGTARSLLIRIYPDDVHDDTHEPELTPDELDLLGELDKRLKAARDMVHLDDAWGDVVRRVGPSRAGWLGEILARGISPTRRPGRLSRPSVARLLPDRWTASVELTDGSSRTQRSTPVREPLETGPSPDGMAWMIDFDAAVDAGMALVVPDLPDPPVEVRRVVVVGARGTLDAADSAAELERALDAQHYTRGLAFVAPGAPTNSLPGARADYSSRPALADVLPIERRRFLIGLLPDPLCRPGDGSDASELAAALGIRTDTFGYVARADVAGGRDGRAVRSLLTEATRRHLTRLLDGILDEAQLAEILGVATDIVSATGTFAALRVGSQPYGVLPVLLRDDARVAPGSFAARALPVLDALRAHWTQAAASLRRVGDVGQDPGETLIRILKRDAVARRVAFRPLLGPQLAAEILGPRSSVDAKRAAAAHAIEGLGAPGASGAPLIESLHATFAPPLSVPFVEPSDAPAGSSQRASTYLELVAARWPDQLLRHDYDGAERPRSLLFAIARLALLERADELARAAHIAAGADPVLWDDEDVPSVFRDALATPQRRLEAQDPTDPGASVAFHLSEQGRDAGALGDVRGTLRRLAALPPAATEEHLRASLGLFSHRLDPWYTALAAERLRELRSDPIGSSGVNVGAYGVVEDLRASPRQPVPAMRGLYSSPINGGYVHAPSAGHGAAAAVLRSVHLGHSAAGHGEAFSVDLSSARVRLGLELLEGIRAGQPLSALLGYRIERALASERLQRLIAPLRTAAPLVAHTLTPGTEPAESVAATNVVDGLALLERAGYDGENPPTLTALLAAVPALGPLAPAEAAGLSRVLLGTADALDAVADLAVAESVYQAVEGNPVRAGGTVDGLSGAPVPPPEIGVVRTPRSGVGVTHRLVVLLEAAAGKPSTWAASPRAVADPALEAWAQAALPSPSRIGIRARLINAEGKQVSALDKLTLGGLMANAVKAGAPELALGALDVVLLADPHETPHRSPLELRLAALIELERPLDAADATLELVFERSKDWPPEVFGFVETLEIARALRGVIARGRPLAPDDLAAPGAAPVAVVDDVELAGRVTAAVSALDDTIKALDSVDTADTAALRRAVFAADLFGVAGAVPATVRDAPGEDDEAAQLRAREVAELRQQVGSALTELHRRAAAVAVLPAAEVAGRLRAVFGEAFTVLTVLTPGSEALAAFAVGALPGGATPALARTWLGRAAPVREAVGALNASLGYADALTAVNNKAPTAALRVGQVGGAIGERWAALPPAAGNSVPGGRISLVAAIPGGNLPSAPAGLLIDEWVEVIPSADETTSVAFHYDAPTAAAPQVWLVGVPPAGFETWAVTDALRIVAEALDLARLRMVDADDVPDLGQLLPAFVTAENTGGDSVGLDIETLTEVRQ